MSKWFSGKRRWYLALAVAMVVVFVVVLVRVVDYELVGEHMYPEDAIYENSNVTVRGAITSIEQNHKAYGFGFDLYHIFRFYIVLNITEVVWVGEDLAASSLFSIENDAIGGRNKIGIGYDNIDDPQLSLGQVIECKGYCLLATDSPYSSRITVAPSVSGSYVETV
jgi:hypothetical protein